jgi:hypothetical protein
MKQNHMIGLVPVEEKLNFGLLRDLGIKWVRLEIGIPYSEKRGEISQEFLHNMETIKRYADNGFKILAVSVLPGSYRHNPETDKIEWHTDLPEWMGSYDSDEFYENLKKGCAETGRLTKGLVDFWQIANEPDAEMFTGPFNDEQLAKFLVSVAQGILEGNPDARNGINPACLRDRTRWLVNEVYNRKDSPFHYLGLDCYFGSWQEGGPQDWIAYINEMHELTGKPIIINEWGYSSLQSSPVTDPITISKEVRENSDGGYEICIPKEWINSWDTGHSDEVQAKYIRECIKIFAESPYVIGNFFFRWNDTEICWRCGQVDCPAECAWGIVDKDEKPKPGYYALQESIKEFIL